jgi:hypothetical protein
LLSPFVVEKQIALKEHAERLSGTPGDPALQAEERVGRFAPSRFHR